MNLQLRTEIVVFALFALFVGWRTYSMQSRPSNTGIRGAQSRGLGSLDYDPAPIPDVDLSLPEEGRETAFSRDLFTPPRDTAPLPLLDLELPPVETLSALAPPTAHGPGVRFAGLLRAEPTPTPVSGLFEEEEELEETPEVQDEGLLEILDPDVLTADERLERIEAFKKLHDWIIVAGRLAFGQIKNKRRFDLARLNEPVFFVEIDPETGLERFPGQVPVAYPRDRIDEFALADTAENYIELRRRDFVEPLRPGDFEGALRLADECVELRNEADGALSIAEEMYRLAAAVDPSDVRPHLGLARCYELGFRFEEALGVYRELTTEGFRSRPEPWARLGDLLARFRLRERAEEHYQEALRLGRAHWESRWRYGRFLLAEGRAEEALAHLLEASRREPSDLSGRAARLGIRADLGACYLELGRPEDSLARFREASSADPGVDRGLAGMISAALFIPRDEEEDVGEEGSLGDPLGDPLEDPLGDVLGDALQQETPDASFDLLLAQGLVGLQAGEWTDSRTYLEAAAASDPFRAWLAWRALSWLAEITGHPEEAGEFIDLAWQSNPVDPWVLYQRGRLLAAQDDALGAMESFKAALDRDVDFADALIALGALSMRLGELEAAERYFERALSIDPERPIVHSLRGLNHLMLGDFALAEADFSAALQRNPLLPSARNGEAWWFYATGDSDEALTRFGALVDARRNEAQGDPHRAYAQDQSTRILDHLEKEIWTDRFDRVGRIGNGWNYDQKDGPEVRLRDGALAIEGIFERAGRTRIYQSLDASRFISFEATVTVHEARDVAIGAFVSRESEGRQGEVRTHAKVELRRHRGDDVVQAAFIKKGQHEAEARDLPNAIWPIGQAMALRIELLGEQASDTRVSLWLDDMPVLEGMSIQSLGRSQMPVRFGVFIEGDGGRSASISIDDVRVVRRH